MFISAQHVMPMPLDAARSALDRALADGGLVVESERAFKDGMAYVMRVRASRGAVVSKQVRVAVLPSREVGSVIVVPLRWEATGPAGRLFPALDVNIELTAAEPGSTRLTLNGCYDPPFGFVGEMIDRALLSVAAQQTAETLVVDIADKLQAMTG
jgi:hypothetical protein